MGLFTHYTYATYRDGDENAWGGTWYSRDDSRPASSPEEVAAMFDGEAFARTAHDLGAEFTKVPFSKLKNRPNRSITDNIFFSG